MKARQNNGLKFSHFSFQMVAAIILSVWIGNKIDKYFDIMPYGLIISLIIGSVAPLYGAWKDSGS